MVVAPWMVIFLILGNTFYHEFLASSVQKVLLRSPQNVTLTSENFFTFLTWQPSLDFTNNTQYEVERGHFDRTFHNWTKVTSCQGNETRHSQRCTLLLPDPYVLYLARVRARDGARLSEWACSETLQPYKDRYDLLRVRAPFLRYSENIYSVTGLESSIPYTGSVKYSLWDRPDFSINCSPTCLHQPTCLLCKKAPSPQRQQLYLPRLPRQVDLASKQAIVGPLNISLTATYDNLTVIFVLPQVPTVNNAPESFENFFKVLVFERILFEEGHSPIYRNLSTKINEETFRFNGRILKHTYYDLTPNTHYCVKAKAIKQPTKEAVQCITMPDSPAGNNWILFVMILVVAVLVLVVLILLNVAVQAFFKHCAQPNPLKTTCPKSLTFLNPESNGHPVLNPVFHMEESYIAPVSAETLLSNTALEQVRPQIMPKDCNAQVYSNYCARGFDAINWSSDSLSSEELEDPKGQNYRLASEFLELSVHSTPSSRFHLDGSGTSCISQNRACQIGDESKLVGCSSSSQADILFPILKLQTTVETLYSPQTCLSCRDSGPAEGVPSPQTTESEKHHKHQGRLKGSDLQDVSSLELKDTKRISSSGYEYRQPILPSE